MRRAARGERMLNSSKEAIRTMTTTLSRWNPFTDLTAVRPLRDVNRLMDDFFRFPVGDLAAATLPPADISEDGEAYTVSVEVPGIKREDIQLSVQDNTLSLRVTRRADKKDETKTYRHVERYYGTFERHFPFASAVDPAKVRASYQDGILEIVLPKAENARERRIEIDVK
jgi:HSP20 family protein